MLVVEPDNATNRHILEEWLRGWQMEPLTAVWRTAWRALDAAPGRAASGRGRPYSLVLLDARMPDTDGLALAARDPAERAALSALRIILLTSGDRPGDLGARAELRIDAHLLKPVQPETSCSRRFSEEINRARRRRAAGAEPSSAGPGTRSGKPAPAISPLHILVAEDNEFKCNDRLERLLTSGSVTVRSTGTTNGRGCWTCRKKRAST